MSNTRKPSQVDDTNPQTGDEDYEDFDAFWEKRTRKGPRVKVFGEVIELPPALPLAFEMEAARMERSRNPQDVTKLLTLLNFPEDTLARWLDKGMDSDQFQVLLAWAPARIAGSKVTLQEVADDLLGDGQGKARKKKRAS